MEPITTPTISRELAEAKDWIVSEIRLSTDARTLGETAVFYPYHISGVNLARITPELFSWNVTRHFADNPRYDLSQLRIDERAATAARRE